MDNPQIDEYGDTCWYNFDGKRHRTDGPAVIWADGSKFWYQHGNRHRDDGPAYESVNGATLWCQHGKWLSFDEWLDEVDISDEDKVMMKLKYG
jgi:hypothetical protein